MPAGSVTGSSMPQHWHCDSCNGPIFKPRVSIDSWGNILEKFRSEYGPHIEKVLGIPSTVDDIDSDVNDYEVEINRLQGRILMLTAKRDRLRSLKAQVQGLNSPIRRLPNEILVRIFEYHCCHNPIGFSYHPKVPSLIVSAVCSRWRKLALCSPRLWADFSVSLNRQEYYYDDDRETLLAAVVELFIQRSKELPLHLKVELDIEPDEDDDVPDSPSEHPAMEALVTHAHRWSAVEIISPCFEPFLSETIHSIHFPLLESIVIRAAPGTTVLSLFQCAPRLKKLTMEERICMFDEEEEQFPWAQLDYLDLSATIMPLFLSIALSTRLTTLRLSVWREYFHIPLRFETTLELPTVRTLRIQRRGLTCDDSSEDVVPIILSSLTTPCLDVLGIEDDIESFGSSIPWPEDTIHSFLARSKCSLSKLALGVKISDSQLLALLPHVSSLRELIVREERPGEPLTSSLLQKLHAGGTTQPLIPNLSRLSISVGGWCGKGQFNEAQFVDMVLSRSTQETSYSSKVEVSPLKYVRVHFETAEIYWEAYEPLRVLEDAGLELQLIGTRPQSPPSIMTCL